MVQRLLEIIEDTAERLKGTPYEHSSGICHSLLQVAQSVAGNYEQPQAKDIALLKPLSDAVLLSFNPDRTASEMAREISQSIHQFKARQIAGHGD